MVSSNQEHFVPLKGFLLLLDVPALHLYQPPAVGACRTTIRQVISVVSVPSTDTLINCHYLSRPASPASVNFKSPSRLSLPQPAVLRHRRHPLKYLQCLSHSVCLLSPCQFSNRSRLLLLLLQRRKPQNRSLIVLDLRENCVKLTSTSASLSAAGQ